MLSMRRGRGGPLKVRKNLRKENMSIAYEKVKIGLEKSGKVQYLSEVTIEDTDPAKVSYQLSADGQVWPNNEAAEILRLLRKAEPDNNFLVFEG